MSNIRDYQVDHLLLLVGSNPLPNAVAGKLLTKTGGTITLIHSSGDSFKLAQRLRLWFLNAGYSDVVLTQVEESDATSVYQKVDTVLKEYESSHGNANGACVGLNYTGGTKVMSVQAYRALEKWAEKHHRDAVFSYLDAHALQMRFDSAHSDRPAISPYVGLEVDISIHELLYLHDWKFPEKAQPVTDPVLPESAAALLAIHSEANDAKAWTEWLHKELFPKARKRVPVKPPVWVSQSGEELQEKLEQPAPNNKWKSGSQLRNLAIEWPPDLPDLRKIMSNELEQGGEQYLNLTVAAMASKEKEEAFCNWLNGIWLESAVLSVLQNCSENLYLKHCCMNLKPQAPDSQSNDGLFEFDVVAIRGYQLFAFSCTTEDGGKGGGEWLLKQKLFECYVRTRQMAGDEACVALICCAKPERVDKLEKEMRRELGPDSRIQIFGREHLANLDKHIKDWIRKQSKEED